MLSRASSKSSRSSPSKARTPSARSQHCSSRLANTARVLRSSSKSPTPLALPCVARAVTGFRNRLAGQLLELVVFALIVVLNGQVAGHQGVQGLEGVEHLKGEL